MFEHNLVLKSDELFLAGDIATDGSGERATGLYLRDTRHLSRFRVSLNGTAPVRLAARVHDSSHATVTTTNALLALPDGSFAFPHQVMVEEQIALDDSLHVTFVLQNFSQQSVQLTLGFEFAADFRDLFDIRGFRRERRGTILDPQSLGRTMVLGYCGLDNRLLETIVTFDREPAFDEHDAPMPPDVEPVLLLPGFDAMTVESAHLHLPCLDAVFRLSLQPGERWQLQTVVTPKPADETPVIVSPAEEQLRRDRAHIHTGDPVFNRVLDRAERDLDALFTRFPHGRLPAAGIPWYVAPFGRDSLIVGLQTLHLMPTRAADTLRVLAALQGSKVDPFREEEPGKILHEMRYGEMARLGEVPHSPYFGTVDATPLFLWLFAETVAWTADHQLFRELLPNVRRAIAWIDQYGDLDGDGLIEYRTDHQGVGRITHQVWKDSWDSLHYPDGRPVTGLIAPVEVQGYVFAAFHRLADVIAVFGDQSEVIALRAKADAIKQKVESAFWLEAEGFYAQALDGDKHPIAAISSNPGHLLACGLPSPDRAKKVAARFQQPDLESGWGIRTLSAGSVSYNPMSYHNGSVWPHDNSLIGDGLYRYGLPGGNQIAASLFAAAQADPLGRLPELYCGFPRIGDDDSPVAYPVSCSPQAWSAGAMLFLVRGMLGLRTDLANRCLLVAPSFPDWLDRIDVHNLSAFGRTGSLVVRCDGAGYSVEGHGLQFENAR